MRNAAVDEINSAARRHDGLRPSVRKDTQSTTARNYGLEIRFADTSSVSTDRTGILAVKKALDAGTAAVVVSTSAQGGAHLVNVRQVISLENNDPTTPAPVTAGTPQGALEACTLGVWLSSGDMVSTNREGIIAIARAYEKGEAMADVLLASGFVRTLAVAHVTHAVSEP